MPEAEREARPIPPDVVLALYPLLNNLYFVHLDIVDVCSRWVPRRAADDERRWLAIQLARESEEVPMYLGLIRALGHEPNVKYRIPDSLNRYGALKETEDELDMAVGMNVLAQGVLGWVEHNQLYRYDPSFFADFLDTIVFDAGNLERAKVFMRRRDPARLQELFHSYHEHMINITLPEIMPLLEPVIEAGVFEPNVVELGTARFGLIAREVGLDPAEVMPA